MNPQYEDKCLLVFLTTLCHITEHNKKPIYKALLQALIKLYERRQFKIHFVSPGDIKHDPMLQYTYGYYSAFDNKIYLVVNKHHFERKWLGMATDYDNFTIESIKSFVVTCTHELMHYCSNTYYEPFIKIWRATMYTHMWNTFEGLVTRYYDTFADTISAQTLTQKQFIESPKYRAVFDVYFNSILINTRFRLHSLQKRYNDILSTLYSKHEFPYARFFDNVLVTAIKLHEGAITNDTLKIYFSIKDAYTKMEPALNKVRMSSLFHQEMFDFSEIACIFATYYQWAPNQLPHIIKSLQLIN